MTKECRNPNDEESAFRDLLFVINSDFVIRVLSFLRKHPLDILGQDVELEIK